MSLHSGRNYELVTAEKAAAIEVAILKTIKVEKASATFKVGKTIYIRLSSALNMANVKKITYTSGNKKAATVDKNGKITAEKAGTTTISAKVTLKSGASKTVKIKIKVKNSAKPRFKTSGLASFFMKSSSLGITSSYVFDLEQGWTGLA